MRAAELRRRLTIRYGKTTQGVHVPEYAIAFEVPFDSAPLEIDGEVVTDYRGRYISKRQRMDAVAVGLWRSTEHAVHGFEIKVSRSDLFAELKNPNKSAPAAALCDYFWLVVAADAWRVEDFDRLPPGWGVLITAGRGLRAIRAATELGNPNGLDRRFVAAVMQSWMRRSPSYGLGRVAGYEDGYKRGERGHEPIIRLLERQLARAEEQRDEALQAVSLGTVADGAASASSSAQA